MKDFDLSEAIVRLQKQGTDDSAYEAKECAQSLSKDVWETVSAFANTGGGFLILGLSEKNGFAPVTNFAIGKVRDQFLSGMGDGGTAGRIANPPHYEITRTELDGHPLLIIKIDELDLSHKPCYITARGIQGGSYKRVDDADIPLSANEIYSLQNANIITSSDRAVVPEATPSDLDENLLAKTLERARTISPRALVGANDLASQRVRLNFTLPDGGITKAGLLAAGLYPQQFYPKLYVDVAVHAGTVKGGVGNYRFLDREVCDGTIGEMIEESITAVARNLRRASVVRGVGREEELEIPEEVLREAVANALIHRDYSDRFDGQAVSIDVFEDRIEVINPGGLWGKSRDSIADGRSCCRNPTLMRLMSLVPLPSAAGSPAEGNGSGIPFMLKKSEERGLKKPIFCPAFDHFKVILYRPSALNDMKVVSRSVSEDESFIVTLLARYGELSSRELMEKSGLTISQVRGRIRKLLGANRIEATAAATSRNRKYRIKQ